MKISDVAQAVGCSVRALRHYHEVGVLPEPTRDSSGYRNYSLEDLAAVFRVRAFIQAGVPLADISDDPAVLERAHTLLSEQVRELQEQQRKLTALKQGRNGVPFEVVHLFDELIDQHPDLTAPPFSGTVDSRVAFTRWSQHRVHLGADCYKPLRF